MKKMKRLMLLLAVLTFMLIPQQTFAASRKTKALKAYSKFMKSGKIKEDFTKRRIPNKSAEFALIYLDNDSVPELMVHWKGGDVIGYPWKNGSLYKFSNGRVVKVKELSIMYKVYYVPKTGYLKDQWVFDDGSSGYNYYRYGSGRIYNGNKYQTRRKYKKIKFHKNTAKNRSRYF